jgi:hypothetical protein
MLVARPAMLTGLQLYDVVVVDVGIENSVGM